MRIVAFITETAPVQRILHHIGEPAQAPPIAPARGPPMWDGALADAVPDWEALAQPETEFLFDQQVAVVATPAAALQAVRKSLHAHTALDPATKRRHTPSDHRYDGFLPAAPPGPCAHALACLLCRW